MYQEDREETYAFNVDHEKGWVIDSGAYAHMTPFRKDCKNIQPTSRKIFLADGSAVLCKEMGTNTYLYLKDRQT